MPSPANDLSSIVWLTLLVSGAAVLMSALVGVPCGAWLGMSRFRGKWLVSAAARTGMAAPPVVVGLLLYLLLSRGGPLAPLEWLFTPWAMVAAQFVLALPFVLGITMHAVASVPEEVAMHARALGASDWQCRWSVLREARRGVILAVAAAFGRGLSEVGAVLIVGGNIEGHTRVLTTAIILETSKGEFALALTLGAVLLSLALLVNLLMLCANAGRPLA